MLVLSLYQYDVYCINLHFPLYHFCACFCMCTLSVLPLVVWVGLNSVVFTDQGDIISYYQHEHYEYIQRNLNNGTWHSCVCVCVCVCVWCLCGVCVWCVHGYMRGCVFMGAYVCAAVFLVCGWVGGFVFTTSHKERAYYMWASHTHKGCRQKKQQHQINHFFYCGKLFARGHDDTNKKNNKQRKEACKLEASSCLLATGPSSGAGSNGCICDAGTYLP